MLSIALAVPSAPGSWATGFEAEYLGESSRELSRPHDLVLSADGRLLYVADLGNDEIKVLDAGSLRHVARFGAGELSSPHDVALDGQGRLLVADTGNDRVAIYALDRDSGTLVGELRGGLASPEGVSVAPDGDIYVTSVAHATVSRFRDGQLLGRTGGFGHGPGQFSRPHDVHATDAQVYVADPGNDRLQVLDRELRFVQALGPGGRFYFNQPKYFDLDARGWLFVADQHNHQVKVYDPAQGRRGVIGSAPRRGDGPYEFNALEGVEVRDDRLWVSDTYNNRIVGYRISR